MEIHGNSYGPPPVTGLGPGTLDGAGALAAKTAAELDALRGREGKEDEEVVAKKMESLFATMLVREMRRALPNGFFGKESGSDVFEGWLDEHLGEALAARGALDLAGMIKAGIHSAESESDR